MERTSYWLAVLRYSHERNFFSLLNALYKLNEWTCFGGRGFNDNKLQPPYKSKGMISVPKFHIARTFVDVPFYVRIHSQSGVRFSLATTNGDEFFHAHLPTCTKDEANAMVDELKAHVYQHPYDTREALVELTEAFFNARKQKNKKEAKAA